MVIYQNKKNIHNLYSTTNKISQHRFKQQNHWTTNAERKEKINQPPENNSARKKQLTKTTPNDASKAKKADDNNKASEDSNGTPSALTSAWESQKEPSKPPIRDNVSRSGNFSNLEKYPHSVVKH